MAVFEDFEQITALGGGFDAVDAPPGGIGMPWWVRCNPLWEGSMSEVTMIGLDLAKTVFQIHGADEAGRSADEPRSNHRSGHISPDRNSRSRTSCVEAVFRPSS